MKIEMRITINVHILPSCDVFVEHSVAGAKTKICIVLKVSNGRVSLILNGLK